jgi:hypothetical protein
MRTILFSADGTDMNWLRKNSAGRRCDQETLPQRFLAQPDGLHAVRRVLRSQHSFSIISLTGSLRYLL